MFSTLLLFLALETAPCTHPYLTGDALYTYHTDQSVLDSALHNVPNSYAWEGIFLTTKVFAEKTADVRRDADSAVYFLRHAQQQCPNSAPLQAYLYAARLLQASKPKIHETRFILDTLRLYFLRLDTLAMQHPSNRSVLCIAGCVLQNAPAILDGGTRYWYRSHVYLSRLDSLRMQCEPHDAFFTREVSANIALNLAHLKGKQASPEVHLDGLQRVILGFPETWAAAQAKKVIQEKILIAPATPPPLLK